MKGDVNYDKVRVNNEKLRKLHHCVLFYYELEKDWFSNVTLLSILSISHNSFISAFIIILMSCLLITKMHQIQTLDQSFKSSKSQFKSSSTLYPILGELFLACQTTFSHIRNHYCNEGRII